MTIQEHLEAFDAWLTGRLEEAYAGRKDLAFRDVAAEVRMGENSWEYSLLDPGETSPHGEGWSVYRLQGVWPKFVESEQTPAARAQPERKSLFGVIAGALLGPDGAKRR
jgi:hypothetical protein